jgi:hypothetical protein
MTRTQRLGLALGLVGALAGVGCTDVIRSRLGAYGEAHRIELYSGGKVVASWESTGKVDCTEGGICDFRDAVTGHLTRTTGDIVVYVK